MEITWCAEMERRRAVTIIVPFYKNEELVAPLIESLVRCASDLAELNASIIAVNDSPAYAPLRKALDEAVAYARPSLDISILENDLNLGFIKSTNRGMEYARRRKTDVILLNSDTIVFPGALPEVQAVAYLDPMIGFVSPRSNNATICTFPVQKEFQTATPENAFSVFQELHKHLPRFHYVPTTVGFCMYIKRVILEEFGVFDEAYGKGYNEENDLVMRANRTGFRAALANHAFVYHAGEASFSVSDTPKTGHESRNADLLARRYPEYPKKTAEYFVGARFQAESLITGLLKDSNGRASVAFDFTTVGPYHNGTFEAATHILSRAAASWSDFQIHVVVSPEAARFHGLDKIPNLYLHPPDTTRVFAAAIRIGQPFQWSVLHRMASLAPVNIYGMLDTIAWDCLHLNQGCDLDWMWRLVFNHADGVFYISEFVARQFRSRFRMHPQLREAVCYLSLDAQDYRKPVSPQIRPNHILVVGNHFAHKRVGPTVEALSEAFPRRTIAVVGTDGYKQQNVVCYPSGHLPEELMDNLYAGASVIVFPSLYEGFGIPLMKALAFRKPLLARDIPVVAELHSKLGSPRNLIRYGCTEDLISLLKEAWPEWTDEDQPAPPTPDWDEVSNQICAFVQQTIAGASVETTTLPRLVSMHDLNNAAHMFAPPSDLARECHELRVAMAERNARISSLEHSFSWRITAPLRLLAEPIVRLLRK